VAPGRRLEWVDKNTPGGETTPSAGVATLEIRAEIPDGLPGLKEAYPSDRGYSVASGCDIFGLSRRKTAFRQQQPPQCTEVI